MKYYFDPHLELHGSESIKQVHAELVDFLGDIPEEIAEGIVGFLYDDALVACFVLLTNQPISIIRCHLKPYAEKPENQLGPKGRQFAGKLLAVDKLHFRYLRYDVEYFLFLTPKDVLPMTPQPFPSLKGAQRKILPGVV